MSKELKQIIITVVLLVVLGVLVFNNLKGFSRRKSGKTRKSQKAASVLLPSLVAITADKKTIKLQKERAESLAWGRDPFEYVETDTDRSYRTDTLVLKGVSLGKDKKGFAFINNDIVQVGDTIGGYEVLQIQRNKVLLKKGNQSFYLTLPEE